jgi:ribonuclease HI
VHWKSSINQIITNVSMSANNSNLSASASISEFTILKAFNISIHPPRSVLVKEVLWCPPIHSWIKGNCDGAFASGKAACGGIFRNSLGQFLGCFAEGLSYGNSLFAELCGAMRSIEFAQSKSWNNFWLETDSMLVVQAFKNSAIVPWQLRNRWINCQIIISNMNFLASHIYREGNSCADVLANIGLTLDTYVYYYSLPLHVRGDYVKNRLGWPSFRFNHS